MIRTILVALFLAIFFIISIPLFIIEEIIGKFDIKKKERSSFIIVMAAFRFVAWLTGVSMTVIGRENVPEDVPVLYTPNHRSYFDIVLLYPLTHNTTGFVAKKSLEKIPCLRRWMRYMNCEFLDRDDVRAGLQSILNCIETVKKGDSICIFPEGTRTSGDELLEFKSGSFKIAERTGCPIIPVAINNTDNIFENHMPYIKKQKVTIEFGKPVYIKDMPRQERKQIGAIIQAQVAAMIEKNKEFTN